MARQPDPKSVNSRIAALKVKETIDFPNPYESVMVMVSLLRKKKDHKDKMFKIKYVDEITSVTRVK